MKVSEIPKVLYEEFSAKFGKGEERIVCGPTKRRRTRDLEDAAREDALTLEEVFTARDWLLKTEPFVVEVFAS